MYASMHIFVHLNTRREFPLSKGFRRKGASEVARCQRLEASFAMSYFSIVAVECRY